MVYYLRIQMPQLLVLLACLLAVPALAQSSSDQPSSVNTFYGAFTHAEPIAVPLFRGLEPSLRLSYSSAGSSGLAGVGWGMALDVSGGFVGPGKGWMTTVLDNLLGWIPGMRVHAVLHDLGGELAVAAGVRPGYLYLGRNWLGMAFDNKLAGQVEGIFITSGRSFTSLLQRAY